MGAAVLGWKPWKEPASWSARASSPSGPGQCLARRLVVVCSKPTRQVMDDERPSFALHWGRQGRAWPTRCGDTLFLRVHPAPDSLAIGDAEVGTRPAEMCTLPPESRNRIILRTT